MDDADGVAELFDLAHVWVEKMTVLPLSRTFANESGNGARGHDIEAVGGFVEDHHGRIVDEGAGNGGFLLHAVESLSQRRSRKPFMSDD